MTGLYKISTSCGTPSWITQTITYFGARCFTSDYECLCYMKTLQVHAYNEYHKGLVIWKKFVMQLHVLETNSQWNFQKLPYKHTAISKLKKKEILFIPIKTLMWIHKLFIYITFSRLVIHSKLLLTNYVWFFILYSNPALIYTRICSSHFPHMFFILLSWLAVCAPKRNSESSRTR